jgi:hypothetical protein
MFMSYLRTELHIKSQNDYLSPPNRYSRKVSKDRIVILHFT